MAKLGGGVWHASIIYFNIFNLAGFPNCITCESAEENLHHILFECFESDLDEAIEYL